MNSHSNRLRFVCLMVAALVLSACSGVHVASTSGGSGSGTGPYSIGGTVTGLTGTGLVLQDNGGDNLTVSKNGAFTFPTSITSGGTYAVTVVTQPTNPAQSCAVTTGTGTATATVTSVVVTCTAVATNATVGGTVSGLTGTGLVLQDNGGDSLTVSGNGSFTFKTTVNGAYAVTVLTQPTGPAQLCTVANGSGTATKNITNVAVTCALSYTIGGTVTGLVGTGLVIQDNNAEKLPITANGSFTFVNQVPTGSPYAITIITQPTGPAQTCVVTMGTGSGTVTSNITSVAIVCPAVTYSIGGTVVGLEGKQPTPPNDAPLTDNSFQLLNNGGDNKIITQNGPFTFATPVADNGAYFISAISYPSTQPQACTLWGYAGVATANVTGILVDCAHDDWTFIGGTATAGTDQAPQYGMYTAPAGGTPEPNPYTNTPGARDKGASWTDSSGNLWLFGGLGYELSGNVQPDTLAGFLSDLWVCAFNNHDYCEWQLVSQSLAAQHENIPGQYTMSQVPGGRWGSATWTDGSGNLWMFGGQGVDGGATAGLLNDLWKYNITGGTWTYVSGAQVVNHKGVYTGAAGSLSPGARWGAVSWTVGGNFWMFGGFGYDANGDLGYLNDLWEYTGGNWVFVSSTIPSSNLLNQNGVYGTRGTAAAGNTPGGRQTAASWVDAMGNLWLFGGEGEDATGTANGVLNDLWEYNISGNEWTYVSGNTAANQTGNYGLQPLVGPSDTASAAGTVGLAPVTSGIFPGSRWGATAWTDQDGNLWLFGGWGLDATGNNGNGYLNDLWVYTPVFNPPNVTPTQAGVWTWVKGSNTGNENGLYGPETRPYFTKVTWTPGGRRGAMSWVDGQNQLWLFGGQGYDSTSSTGNGYLNDLWRYLPYP